MLKIDFVSLFPQLILDALGYSIPKRANEMSAVQYRTSDPRDFTIDHHRTVDDKPYGGGAGMLMMAEFVAQAIEHLIPSQNTEIIFTDPIAPLFTQESAVELSSVEHIIFVCGRYEGIDERVKERFATRTYSIGDYILSGGEFASLVMADAIVRLLPNVLGKPESLLQDSFSQRELSYPQYTRPHVWRGQAVPDVLLSGHHKQIADWRIQKSLENTLKIRPDLLEK